MSPGKTDRTNRNWCLDHQIGRRIAGHWAVSAPALDMLLAGDNDGLQAYLAGDRTSEPDETDAPPVDESAALHKFRLPDTQIIYSIDRNAGAAPENSSWGDPPMSVDRSAYTLTKWVEFRRTVPARSLSHPDPHRHPQ